MDPWTSLTQKTDPLRGGGRRGAIPPPQLGQGAQARGKEPLLHLAPGPAHPRYPSHPLLQDLYTLCTPPNPCSRTCTPHVLVTSPCSKTCTLGPVHPRYPSHPLLQNTPGTPHIPCSRTFTPQVPLTPLAPGPPLHLNLLYPPS